MGKVEYVRADVLLARREGLVKCPCGATYSIRIEKCPKCGRPNPDYLK